MALVATSAVEPSIESASTPKTSFRAAGLFRRSTAMVMDLLLVVPLQVLAVFALRVVQHQPVPRLAELSPDVLLASLSDGSVKSEAMLVLGLTVALVYFWLFVGLFAQTPGKWLTRLLVVDVYGDRPSLLRAMVRTLSYGMAVLPCSLGVLWIGFDREKRGLHDWLAGTYVVLKP